MDNFETFHKINFSDSTNMSDLKNETVHLIVTSPPYPMIKMWDKLFYDVGCQNYDEMHEYLAKTWRESYRVLVDGGICCINIGDATRTINGVFRVYPNHARIIEICEKIGFVTLPYILWKKPTNKPNKFMGSGMLPSNAYATLEQEYILIFRKGSDKRKFKVKDVNRYNSAYFWEERNNWFSDNWTNLKGITQKLKYDDLRERSAAYPFELAYRLINMYSIHGDTVLDPFWGTGTTTIAAMCSARNSIGYEIERNFFKVFQERMRMITKIAKEKNNERLVNHVDFMKKREGDLPPKHIATHYDFGVVTSQEKDILLYDIENVEQIDDDHYYKVTHKKHNFVMQKKMEGFLK